MISGVFLPLIRTMDTKNDWRECDEEQKKEFVNVTNKFSDELEEGIKSLSDSIETCKIDTNYVNSANEVGKSQYYEDIFEKWLNSFKEKLNDDQERNKKLTEGPRTELIHWKARLQDITLLSELTRSKDFMVVKNFLNNHSNRRGEDTVSKVLSEYKNIENQLTEKLNEAKDNVKYLTTLEKFIEPLYDGTPEEINDTLPALMNAIKMIHTIARYYNTSNKMTNLFIKITNQMITNCKNRITGKTDEFQTIDKDNIWQKNPDTLIEILNSCITLCQKYKTQYDVTKTKAAELPKSRHWDFDDNVIFGKFDTFIKRVKKLIEIFSTIQQFKALEKHNNLEGMPHLTEGFNKKIENFKKKRHDLLDAESVKFDKDYVDLMQDIQKLDTDLQNFIDTNFSKFKNISYSLKLLKKFEAILKRDNIRNRLTNKYEAILQNYGSEIDGITKLFDEQKLNPPIIRNMPADAGKIIWVRHLFAKLSGPIEEFPPNLINSKEMKKYIDKFNYVGKNIIIYELYFTQSWCNDIERAKACLQTTLLVMKEENNQKRIKVNFERDIQKLIREAKALDREGIGGIPESAKIILLQEDKFKNYYFELDYIKNEYERIIGKIKPIMKNLLNPHIEDIDLKLRPGMVTLTWTSMNIDGFLQNFQQSLNKLEQLILTINDIIENRIENNLKLISKVILVKLPEDGKPLSLDAFVEDQHEHIQAQAELLMSKNIEIERAVDDLLACVMNYPLDPHIHKVDVIPKAAKTIKGYYFWYLYQALLNSTQNSLNAMKNRVCGKRSTGDKQHQLKPFFEVDVKLEDGVVKLDPSLDEIQKSINRAATAVLSCSKKLLRWDQLEKKQGAESEEKESFYKIIAQDKEIVKVILLLTGSIQGTKNKVTEFLQYFSLYQWLWNDSIQDSLKDFSKKNPHLQEYEEKLKKFSLLEDEIDSIERTREIGAMALKTGQLITGLKARCKEWKNHYAEDLHIKAQEQLYNLTENMKNLSSKLQKDVKGIDSLGLVMTTLEEIRIEQADIDINFDPVLDMYLLLDTYLPGGITDKEELESRQLLKKIWGDLIKTAETKQRDHQKEQAGHLKVLKQDVKQLVTDVKEFRKNFEEEGPMVQGITPKEASDRLKRFENEFELKEAIYKVNKRGEDLFGLQNQEYPALDKTKKEIQNLNKLYHLYNQVIETTSSWEEEAWGDFDSNHIKDWEDVILKYSDNCKRLPTDLKGWQAFKDLKDKIENYKELLPFIKELKDPTIIKDRHWDRIIELSGKELNYKQPDNFFFWELQQANLMDFVEDLEDVIDSAKKQEKIEKQKNEIREFWDDADFQFRNFGTRELPILSGTKIEEIQERLEEDIGVLSGLSAMRHVGPFKEEVSEWQEILSEVDSNLSLWLKVQVLWCSLESVFLSGDISKHMNAEAKRFTKLDKQWCKTVMEKAVEQKIIKQCCQNEIIKGSLPLLQDELEACQKQLEIYLSQKRKEFPRFYFVSNPVLLKFLSLGSDPNAIQDEFDKLFDSVSRVNFEQEKKNPVKIISAIKFQMGSVEECIDLDPKVKCVGNIESWLSNLEKNMQLSLKGIIKQASDMFLQNTKDGSFNLVDLVGKFCAQVALIGIQMKWTRLVQDALEKKSTERNRAITETKQETNSIMDTLVEMCKTDLGSNMNRQKLESLVTIQVYLKDKVIEWKFRESTDFEWLQKTRCYWREEKDEFVVEITDWECPYSYEYLGVKERLCITPLTDRCYITLAQAMNMNFGGAPAGPAGTGKTETVKDLGRCLGIFVVVTNCSGEHRTADMAKIFKGLCQSGLWGCFDEFNRIDLEVLSVVAMQVESITAAKKLGLKEFYFPDEANKVQLHMACGYFITMNPGYAGRQELPENLKVLFRGVTMMVPSREIIIKVKLASVGFKDNVELSKKFKVLYGLCEEQLSKQRHYDFGLRNILSVLRTAGNILREEPGSTEEMLLMRTLRDMNLSKLVYEDISLFNALLSDIFPKQEEPKKKSYPEIEKKIAEKVAIEKLIGFPPWVLKIIQLYETSLVRHGFMLIGTVGTGKSAVISVLCDC